MHDLLPFEHNDKNMTDRQTDDGMAPQTCILISPVLVGKFTF